MQSFSMGTSETQSQAFANALTLPGNALAKRNLIESLVILRKTYSKECIGEKMYVQIHKQIFINYLIHFFHTVTVSYEMPAAVRSLHDLVRYAKIQWCSDKNMDDTPLKYEDSPWLGIGIEAENYSMARSDWTRSDWIVRDTDSAVENYKRAQVCWSQQIKGRSLNDGTFLSAKLSGVIDCYQSSFSFDLSAFPSHWFPNRNKNTTFSCFEGKDINSYLAENQQSTLEDYFKILEIYVNAPAVQKSWISLFGFGGAAAQAEKLKSIKECVELIANACKSKSINPSTVIAYFCSWKHQHGINLQLFVFTHDLFKQQTFFAPAILDFFKVSISQVNDVDLDQLMDKLTVLQDEYKKKVDYGDSESWKQQHKVDFIEYIKQNLVQLINKNLFDFPLGMSSLKDFVVWLEGEYTKNKDQIYVTNFMDMLHNGAFYERCLMPIINWFDHVLLIPVDSAYDSTAPSASDAFV